MNKKDKTIKISLKELKNVLTPFAKMYRLGTDKDEIACVRGVASDMTLITSEDFERAFKYLKSLDPKYPYYH